MKYGSFAAALVCVAGLVVDSSAQEGPVAQDSPVAPIRFSDDVHRLVPADTPLAPSVAADFDGDGDFDLLHGTRLLLDDGERVWRDAGCGPPYPDEVAYSYTAGDVDGDLDLDVIACTVFHDSLWRNDGTGCFTDEPLPNPPFVGIPSSSTVGDVDGDGDLDVVIGRNSGWNCEEWCEPGYAQLLVNDGAGHFTDATAQIEPAPNEFPAEVVLGDVDGDLDPDLLIATVWMEGLDGPHRLLLNDGSGRFTVASGAIPYGIVDSGTTISARFADFDGDSDLDILLGCLSLWLNDGTGRFVDASSNLRPYPGALIASVGDLDGDVDEDILACAWGGRNAILINIGAAHFEPGGEVSPRADPTGDALLCDFDLDGDLDVLLARATHAELVFNDGTAHFTGVPPLLPSTTRAESLAVGDVDGNRLPDVLIATYERDGLFLNDASGAFFDASERLPAGVDSSSDCALADVDGDDDLDALVVNSGWYPAQPDVIYLNDGSGFFTAAPELWPDTFAPTYSLAVGDVDRDGDVDVLACNGGGDASELFFNDGMGALAQVPGKWPAGSFDMYRAAFGDLDSDGDLDVMVGRNGLVWFRNDGSGGFAEAAELYAATTSSYVILLFDFDFDGDIDCVCSHPNYGSQASLRAYVNIGGSFLEEPSRLPHIQERAHGGVAADLDADGDLDLAISTVGESLVLVNDGAGFFTEVPGPEPELGVARTVVAADTDRDGDTDLVCSQTFGHARVLVNLRRQLAWHSLPRIAASQTFDLDGAPGGRYRFAGSFATAAIPFGTAGVLRISPDEIFHDVSGAFDASGHARESFRVPADPSWIGLSVYWQALHFAPRRLGNLEITTFRGR